MLYNVEDMKAPPQLREGVSSNDTSQSYKRSEKRVRSPSIFVMCVQLMRILMDHKGARVQALTEGLVQGSTSLLMFFSRVWTCEVCRLTNTTSHFSG